MRTKPAYSQLSPAKLSTVAIIAAIILLASAAWLQVDAQVENNSGKEAYIVIYGTMGCPHCRALKGFLEENYDGLVHFCEVREEECMKLFLILYNSGITSGYPTSIVCRDEGNETTLYAIVVGEYKEKSFWDKLLRTENTSIGVAWLYYGGKLVSRVQGVNSTIAFKLCHPKATEPSPRETISKPAGKPEGSKNPVESSITLIDVIVAVGALAAVDSINPCAMYIYSTVLIATLIRSKGDKRRVYEAGTGFTIAVYAGYYLLGVGLVTATIAVPKWVAGLIALAYAGYVAYTGLSRKPRLIAPRWATRRALSTTATFAASFALGLILSLTLLPCSSGPYLVFASLASKLGMKEALVLLAIYNLVFVAPLIAIMLLAASIARAKKTREFFTKHSRLLSIVSATILALLGAYLLVA